MCDKGSILIFVAGSGEHKLSDLHTATVESVSRILYDEYDRPCSDLVVDIQDVGTLCVRAVLGLTYCPTPGGTLYTTIEDAIQSEF